jgi:hypothetical protein
MTNHIEDGFFVEKLVADANQSIFWFVLTPLGWFIGPIGFYKFCRV